MPAASFHFCSPVAPFVSVAFCLLMPFKLTFVAWLEQLHPLFLLIYHLKNGAQEGGARKNVVDTSRLLILQLR